MVGSPKLVLLSAQQRGTSFELENDVYTIGRSETQDIVIKDPTISTYHCDLVKKGDTYVIKDNNSTNGTRVNNVPVEEQELKGSDIIQLGGVEILFDNNNNVSTVMKTQTNIDINNTDIGVTTIKTMEQEESKVVNKSKDKIQLLMIGAIVVLVIILLAILITLLTKFMN
ncbi:FHA domain-containing protein [Lentisphaerota bacterium WC36G]|nr:FHA domain-containing protein [Lentisphaerae bacterium WC36]